MYGQKTSLGLASTGITVASWWMWGMTVMLAVVAVILLGRTIFALHARNERRLP